MLTIIVRGTPAPQGSKRFVGLSKAGRGIMVESSKAVNPWREAVKHAALDVQGSVRGPVEVSMIFTVKKPASAPKKRRIWPDKKPDLSKLVRATEDALTDAGKWEDDARVVKCLSEKVYPNEGVYALEVPGCVIRITPVFAA